MRASRCRRVRNGGDPAGDGEETEDDQHGGGDNGESTPQRTQRPVGGEPDGGQVELRAGDVRVPRERFAGIWGTLVHAIENALEHGFESPAERQAQGKSGPGKLSVRARVETNACIVEIADDGRGVDWKEVGTRARAQRMPHVTREELVEVLFAPGFSMREARGELTGHGFGLLAVREACHELHGSVLLISSPGRGTTLRISIPMRAGEIPFTGSTAPGPRSLRAPFVTRIEHKRTIAQ
jgi:hypothetical protein